MGKGFAGAVMSDKPDQSKEVHWLFGLANISIK
jgi:hypothetical protein